MNEPSNGQGPSDFTRGTAVAAMVVGFGLFLGATVGHRALEDSIAYGPAIIGALVFFGGLLALIYGPEIFDVDESEDEEDA